MIASAFLCAIYVKRTETTLKIVYRFHSTRNDGLRTGEQRNVSLCRLVTCDHGFGLGIGIDLRFAGAP